MPTSEEIARELGASIAATVQPTAAVFLLLVKVQPRQLTSRPGSMPDCCGGSSGAR